MSDTEAEKPDDVTAAIGVAKAFLLQAFQGEAIENLGLEEVVPVRPEAGEWNVTFGFNRRWQHPAENNSFLQMAALAAAARPARTYKIVKVNVHGPRGLSITNRKDD
ncbi:MAG: hypothetical protein ACRYGC_06255 [Janthinobacterium lividum]